MSSLSDKEELGTMELTPPAPLAGTVTPPLPAKRSDSFIDWRTLDPSTIQGEGIPLEELLFYREKIENLLATAPGRYVLIVGREIGGYFETLELAARYAAERYGRRPILIKKVVSKEPVHTFGSIVR
jgi:hypothetical protein